MTPTRDYLNEVKRRADAATVIAWDADWIMYRPVVTTDISAPCIDVPMTRQDIQFYSEAITGVPKLHAMLTAALDALERSNNKLKAINEMFCGHGLEVANWHANGTTEPMESFFEENDWEPEAEALAKIECIAKEGV